MVIKPVVNTKYGFLVAAGIVLVFASIQIYWVLAYTASIISGLSILTSLGLVSALIALSQSHQNIVSTAESSPEALEKTNVEAVVSDDDYLSIEDTVICNEEADEYFKTIKEDLSQVDRLVSDAINNLVISFKFINELTKSHHEMVTAIEKLAAPEGSKPILALLKKQMVVADKIESELDTAVTSLQFGDLVTQLIGHSARQMETLQSVLQRVDRKLDLKAQKKSVDEINAKITHAITVANSGTKKKPVVQQNMQMGDIELF
ncbi:MAG: hypothetical protein OEX11_01505 [Nitrosomonas sp.]|nr:hypothetical protein [Nitrosomonas sp.]